MLATSTAHNSGNSAADTGRAATFHTIQEEPDIGTEHQEQRSEQSRP